VAADDGQRRGQRAYGHWLQLKLRAIRAWGAHLLVQVSTHVLNDDLANDWYPASIARSASVETVLAA